MDVFLIYVLRLFKVRLKMNSVRSLSHNVYSQSPQFIWLHSILFYKLKLFVHVFLLWFHWILGVDIRHVPLLHLVYPLLHHFLYIRTSCYPFKDLVLINFIITILAALPEEIHWLRLFRTYSSLKSFSDPNTPPCTGCMSFQLWRFCLGQYSTHIPTEIYWRAYISAPAAHFLFPYPFPIYSASG